MYHHLGSFEDSLTYALGAGNLFDVMSNSEYVQTTIGNIVCPHFIIICVYLTDIFLSAKCMDFYSQQKVAIAEGSPDVKPIDSRY